MGEMTAEEDAMGKTFFAGSARRTFCQGVVAQQETHQGQGAAALVPGHYSGYLETQAGQIWATPTSGS